MGTVEIYALCEPATGRERYVGKAKDAQKRLFGHIYETGRRRTPLYSWMKSLRERGERPLLKILEVVSSEEWREAERRWIEAYRLVEVDLLNLADGGDEPFCPREVRAANGRKSSQARQSSPLKRRVWELKLRVGQLHSRGELTEKLRAAVIYAGAKRPELFGKIAAKVQT